ncbi:metal ABC transporter substrate-binding protein [Nocardioides sp. CFH 31398]|uniref:metal ABC transporter substrate-binding protein n=1 Tax=Nocardioides sp. CFH 31398 TaxID=2919579 RepID=UPI001F06D703|nr:metal ABC transporter substrate-binding protein [Nocardioides sp. CFH 31398]MCH1868462.1 metal ABC transporter substrate-binding protein [Nocardioides sp. CFH 31398]
MPRRPRSRLLAPAALGLCAVLTLSGCGALTGADDGAAAASDGSPQVVAAFYPLAWATEQVAGDRADVANLTTPGAEPHDLELGIGETAEITDADLVVFESGFQVAVDAAVEENGPSATLDAADVVELIPASEEAEDGHDHSHEGEEHSEEEHSEEGHSDEHSEDEHSEDEHGHSEDDGHSHDEDAAASSGGTLTVRPASEEDHDHGDLDPHFWQDPMRMADLADAVAESLGEIDPEGAGTYADNAAALREELTDLDAAYADGLASCERDLVVVNHGAFGYLGKYGLTFEAITGLTPDAEPTPAARAEIEELARDEGVTTVFSETLASPEAAQSLADDLGVEMSTLDPIEGLSDQTADQDYLSLMRSNLEALQAANGC